MVKIARFSMLVWVRCRKSRRRCVLVLAVRVFPALPRSLRRRRALRSTVRGIIRHRYHQNLWSNLRLLLSCGLRSLLGRWVCVGRIGLRRSVWVVKRLRVRSMGLSQRKRRLRRPRKPRRPATFGGLCDGCSWVCVAGFGVVWVWGVLWFCVGG